MKITILSIIYYLFVTVLGSTLVWAFPPHAFPYTVYITMTVFLLGLEQRGRKSSFWYGYFFYLGAVIAFIGYWFSYYFRLQLGCSHLVSYGLTSIICLYTSTYIGVIAWLYTKFKTRNQVINLVLYFPSLWILTELVRGLFFPRSWYAFGYTQVDNILFRGYFPLFGVYFVSWLVMALSGWFSYFLLKIALDSKAWPKMLVKLCLSAIIFIGLSYALAQVKYTHKFGPPITVALIQPSIFSSKNADPDSLILIEQISEELVNANEADLYVLPETVFGADYHYLTPGYLDTLNAMIKRNDASLFFGTPIHGLGSFKQTGTVDLDRLSNPVYIKHNLVPFGEYNPLKDTFLNPLLMSAIGDQISEYTAGDKVQDPAEVKGQKFAFDICYENTINDFVAKSAKNATILINQSDLSWYGKTQMKDAFFQFSQGRALENQRYFLQDGNTGDTAIINQNGEVEHKLSPFSPGALVGMVQGYSGITPFERFGNFPVWILACSIILIVLLFKYWHNYNN